MASQYYTTVEGVTAQMTNLTFSSSRAQSVPATIEESYVNYNITSSHLKRLASSVPAEKRAGDGMSEASTATFFSPRDVSASPTPPWRSPSFSAVCRDSFVGEPLTERMSIGSLAEMRMHERITGFTPPNSPCPSPRASPYATPAMKRPIGRSFTRTDSTTIPVVKRVRVSESSAIRSLRSSLSQTILVPMHGHGVAMPLTKNQPLPPPPMASPQVTPVSSPRNWIQSKAQKRPLPLARPAGKIRGPAFGFMGNPAPPAVGMPGAPPTPPASPPCSPPCSPRAFRNHLVFTKPQLLPKYSRTTF